MRARHARWGSNSGVRFPFPRQTGLTPAPLSAFPAAEVRFLVVGAHAVSFHAVPRYTKDLDLRVEPTPENAARAWDALARFGAPLEGVGVEDLSTPGIVIQLGVEPNRIDILTRVAGLEFGAVWERRVTSTYGGITVTFPSLDDLLASKRACGRPQDLLDASWLEKAKRILERSHARPPSSGE